MTDVVDRIIAELIARDNGYTATYEKATKAVREHTDALKGLQAIDKKADASAEQRAASRRKVSDGEKAAAAESKAASKARADAEKAAAKVAADAVKAAEKEKQLAAKATAKELADAAKAATARAEAERAAAAAVVAATEREAAARERLAAVVARGVAAAGVKPGTGRNIGITVPREPAAQASIPASVINGPAPAAAAEREINHTLADTASLQARLSAARGADADILRDELRSIELFNRYQRAGLTEAEAAVRVEQDLAAIEAGRAKVAAQQAAAEKQLRVQSNKTGATISLLAPTLVGGITAHEISALNDAYIQLTNTLKVAGVGAAEFDQVQAHLLETANRSGTDINALADVYRGAALASHDLGASQADLLKITDAAANALRISGRSSTEARGALLQLSHAFESGRVTAREFNSLALNLYPILQAVAKGSDQYGGSVAKLRQALIDGDISSKVFFQDLLRGADDLAERAGKATLTTAQGFNVLRNSLIVYFGETDKAQGVSAALGAALQKLAANLDVLIPAIVAVGTALATGYIVRLGVAAIATERLGAGILAAFGGPVGLSITAVTLAIGTFAAEANDAAEGARATKERLEELEGQLATTSSNAHAAANGLAGLGTDALGAIPKVERFAGAVGNLAQQLYNQARAARSARVETLNQQLAEGRKKELEFGAQTQAGRAVATTDAASGLKKGDVLGYVGNFFSRVKAANTNLLSGGKSDRDLQAQYENQVRGDLVLQRQLQEAKSAPITSADIPGGIPSGLSAKNEAALAKLQGQVADLEKLKATASGKELATINEAIAKREKQISYIEQGMSKEAAAAAAGVEQGAPGRRPTHWRVVPRRQGSGEFATTRLTMPSCERPKPATSPNRPTSRMTPLCGPTSSGSECGSNRSSLPRRSTARDPARAAPGNIPPSRSSSSRG